MIFRRGVWYDGYDWHDPSWSSALRNCADSFYITARLRGFTEEAAIVFAENEVYAKMFSGITRKQHDAPENQEKENRVKKEARGRGAPARVCHRKYPAN